MNLYMKKGYLVTSDKNKCVPNCDQNKLILPDNREDGIWIGNT